MTLSNQVQFVSDQEGKPVGVLVPIELWRAIESELETAYLLKSDAMKQRLLDALHRDTALTLDDVHAQLGI